MRYLLVLFIVLSVVLAGTPIGPSLAIARQATPVAAPVATDPLVDAVAWLQAQQLPDGGFAGFDGGPDAGVTADAVVALRAAEVAGVDSGDALPGAVVFLEGRTADAVAAGPGPVAKMTLATVAGGRDPRTFGGVNLVAALTEPVPVGTPIAVAGAYGDDLYDHLLVVLSLTAAGEPVPPAALDLIRATQAATGGWAFDGSTEPEATDSNTTALAIQALVAVGLPTDAGIADGSDLVNDPAVVAGLAALRTFQTVDGGFVFQPSDPPMPDANSTALAVQAILAVGQDPSAPEWGNAAAALRGFANPGGAIRYVTADPADNLFATLQAIPALAEMPLPVARLCRGPAAAPAVAPPPVVLDRGRFCLDLDAAA